MSSAMSYTAADHTGKGSSAQSWPVAGAPYSRVAMSQNAHLSKLYTIPLTRCREQHGDSQRAKSICPKQHSPCRLLPTTFHVPSVPPRL